MFTVELHRCLWCWQRWRRDLFFAAEIWTKAGADDLCSTFFNHKETRLTSHVHLLQYYEAQSTEVAKLSALLSLDTAGQVPALTHVTHHNEAELIFMLPCTKCLQQ